VTIAISEDSPSRLRCSVSPMAELVALLHAHASPGHHSLGRLSGELDEAMSAPGRRELRRLIVLWSGYRARFLFPGPSGPSRDFEEELSRLGRLSLDNFLESAAWAVRGGYSGSPASDVLSRDVNAQGEILLRAKARGESAEELARQLFDDPDAVRRRVMNLLADVYQLYFDNQWKAMSSRLEADVSARAALAQNAGASTVIASLSPAARVMAPPLRVRIDKMHHGYVRLAETDLWMIPSALGWPHFLVKHEPGWSAIIQYPVHDPSLKSARPLLRDVRARMEVVVDANRLSLCRLIAREPASTSDLAARTGMPASQVSRHLRRLRDAGLVHQHREGRMVIYELDLDGFRNLGSDLLNALLR